MRRIRIHDSLSGEVRPLEPREPGKVGMYVCGPTVYGRVHVGNARPFVVFALLKRFLEHEGEEVTLVENVTDVNDKIYAAARAAGVASTRLAAQMTEHYVADTSRLELGRPDHEPRAAATIEPIVDLIADLIDGGHAYEAGGDVYFRVDSFPGYGKLSNRPAPEMRQGEGDDAAELKQSPRDFALWKAHKEGEDTSWPAPWGPGRPGWHIECSAMAEELLGTDFEIHGGGSDLVFPHHENEIAQTEAARGKPLARIWMHNGMVQMGEEKMAKSVGNIAPLHAVLAAHGRAAVLMYLCGAHYRQPIAFGPAPLAQARASLARLREVARRLDRAPSPADMAGLRDRFLDALADDFNTPQALAAMFDWVREANRRAPGTGDSHLREMLALLGLEELVDDPGASEGAPDPDALALLQRREQARARRDFATADAVRDQLRRQGWEVRDGPDGPILVVGQR